MRPAAKRVHGRPLCPDPKTCAESSANGTRHTDANFSSESRQERNATTTHNGTRRYRQERVACKRAQGSAAGVLFATDMRFGTPDKHHP